MPSGFRGAGTMSGLPSLVRGIPFGAFSRCAGQRCFRPAGFFTLNQFAVAMRFHNKPGNVVVHVVIIANAPQVAVRWL